jgi:polysaccharide deacetylase family protein (PEP-CTERM system associated)
MTSPVVSPALGELSLTSAPASQAPTTLAHHFTVDVEEYFQVSAFENLVPRARWTEMESRVEASVDVLLSLCDAAGVKGTFFTLGWIAEHHPRVVTTIADAGHEIASHGWDHKRITHIDEAELRKSLRDSKRVLEDLTGREVLGFRAPSFSIVPGREWALDALIDEGYRYDSSLFPIRRSGYGYPGTPRDPYWIRRPAGRLAELPPATLEVFGVRVPAAGGGYFRLLPYSLTHAALADCERRGTPGTFYIHPWEVDPDQPRVAAPLRTRIRHYTGIARTADRIRRLLGSFRFRPMAETVEAM